MSDAVKCQCTTSAAIPLLKTHLALSRQLLDKMNGDPKKPAVQQLRAQLKALEKSVTVLEQIQKLHEQERNSFMQEILDITKKRQINVNSTKSAKMHTTPFIYGAEANTAPAQKRKKK